jgi:adenylate kinase
MIWIFLGAPGAGKGTQAERLAEHLGVLHLSTGNVLRKAVKEGTELGRKAETYMKAGNLVPDALILDLVREVLTGDAPNGCILDGYPRNAAQAASLDEMLSDVGEEIGAVINLNVSEETLVTRIAGRAEAEDRTDDDEETVRNRLKVYGEQTAPLVDYYRGRGGLQEVDGEGTVDEIEGRIREIVGARAGGAAG